MDIKEILKTGKSLARTDLNSAIEFYEQIIKDETNIINWAKIRLEMAILFHSLGLCDEEIEAIKEIENIDFTLFDENFKYNFYKEKLYHYFNVNDLTVIFFLIRKWKK